MYLSSNSNSVSNDTEIIVSVTFDSAVEQRLVVDLYCDNSECIIQRSVEFNYGDSTVSFSVISPTTVGFEEFNIVAMYTNHIAVLTVSENTPTEVSVFPTVNINNRVVGGNTIVLRFELNSVAPSDQIVYVEESNLDTNPKVLVVQSIVTIDENNHYEDVTVDTKTVNKNTVTFLKYRYKGVVNYHQLVVTP